MASLSQDEMDGDDDIGQIRKFWGSCECAAGTQAYTYL